ncbi:hypothetical protein MKK55_28635 [Methylobacterium sp. J-059]|uniref:hypothetical protein n=1 Tax=Methylobacterium sp. J-059 TaxID=2836643 RepID=UPI001FBC0C78|nr:hypothetical protein [Methylobacterium sp. J-059]MCJ2042884.1 hypothetical protein [Methylobacterium sp. J-059]
MASHTDQYEHVDIGTQAEINNMFALRGRIITSYSQIEFLVGDLFRLLQRSYNKADEDEVPLPYRIEGRIRSLTRLCSNISDMDPYRTKLKNGLDEILEFSELRNYMAHGYVDVDKYLDGYKFRFLMYKFLPKGEVELHKMDVQLDKLQRTSDVINECTERLMELVREIYITLGLQDNRDVGKS